MARALTAPTLGEVRGLAREHLGENVFFLYSSDHGAQWPFGKWNLYDAGTRVGLIASWPNVIEPGSRMGAMVSWVDILPTLIEAAGGRCAGRNRRAVVPRGVARREGFPARPDFHDAQRRRAVECLPGAIGADAGLEIHSQLAS